ncbi:hypothetical protein HK104_000292, partial [Borealophlyctis nickersoniae]
MPLNLSFGRKGGEEKERDSTTNQSPSSNVHDPETGAYHFYDDPLSRSPSHNDRSSSTSHPLIDTSNEEASEYARKALEDPDDPNYAYAHHGPPALFDPIARQKLEKFQNRRPWFLYAMTAIQIGALILGFVLNQKTTGSVIETQPQFNYLIGPTSGILITMGARFVPCIRNVPGFTNLTAPYLCPAGIKGSLPDPTLCTMADLCSFNAAPLEQPKQWYRFILPILLHAGILHFLFNMLFQVRTGFQMERDWGWWRMAAIYFASGIGGFIFGANFAPLTPSVGCSGSLYGLMACLLLELFQNWRLVNHPYWELFKMVLQIAISLLIGTLPFIDNFAHIGGFYCGLVAGLIFMPTVYYGKWDKWRKRGLMILAVPALILIFVFLIKGFYDAGE